MPPKRKAQSPQQAEEVEKKPKVSSGKRRRASGESSRSDTSSRSSNHRDSDASSNDSFYSVSDYYQPEKRGRFDENLLGTVDSAESNFEYKFYRETPAKRKLNKLCSQRDAKECIGKLTDKFDCLGEETEHTIIRKDDAGFRMDYQRSYSGERFDGRNFAVLAVQKGTDMYASAHVETDVSFGHLNVQKALTHSLEETNKAGADPKGHRVRLIRVEKAKRLKSPNKPLYGQGRGSSGLILYCEIRESLR